GLVAFRRDPPPRKQRTVLHVRDFDHPTKGGWSRFACNCEGNRGRAATREGCAPAGPRRGGGAVSADVARRGWAQSYRALPRAQPGPSAARDTPKSWFRAVPAELAAQRILRFTPNNTVTR